MPRFPSTNPAGLREVPRMAVCQGMVRSSRSPDWSAIVASPGNPIVTSAACDGKTLHSTAKIGERLQFCALPFDGAHQPVPSLIGHWPINKRLSVAMLGLAGDPSVTPQGGYQMVCSTTTQYGKLPERTSSM